MSVTAQKVKCVVWDLDNTLWQGVLVESSSPMEPRAGVVEAIKELDRRGILQSVASKNDFEPAIRELHRLELAQYFLYPQIDWSSKSGAIKMIADQLNIGMDTFAFIDDQPFERDEVSAVHPNVRCYPETFVEMMLAEESFMPLFVTEESARRREMYQQDGARHIAREAFEGPEEAFLRGLDLVLTIKTAGEEDLMRAEELTMRTNQLNTTGVTYSADDLRDLVTSPHHQVVVAELSDSYGSYGVIGLILLSTADNDWCIDLFLMSCRVMSRGVGGVLLTLIRQAAGRKGVKLKAQFRHTDRNRIMFITYRFAGFSESEEEGKLINDLSDIAPLPDYIQILGAENVGWSEHV